MTTWNGLIAEAFFSTAIDVTTPVGTERDKIKVGYPCIEGQQKGTNVYDVFGTLESVTCEFTWDRHPRMPDLFYQHEIACGRFPYSYIISDLFHYFSFAEH